MVEGAPPVLRLVRVARVVVVAGVSPREPSWSVVVQDEGLARVLREVDDDVGPFGTAQQQRVLVHVAD